MISDMCTLEVLLLNMKIIMKYDGVSPGLFKYNIPSDEAIPKHSDYSPPLHYLLYSFVPRRQAADDQGNGRG